MAAYREPVTEHVAGPVGIVSSKKNGPRKNVAIMPHHRERETSSHSPSRLDLSGFTYGWPGTYPLPAEPPPGTSLESGAAFIYDK